MKPKAIFFVFAAAPFLASAASSTPDASKPSELPALGVPLITKLGWETSAPFVADVDGDGRKDILVLNNDMGRIEILCQRRPGEPAPEGKNVRADRWMPVLDNAPFRRDFIAGDASMRGLAAADLDGDGLADILFTSARNGLHIVPQGPRKGEWRTPIKENAALSRNSTGEAGALMVFPAGPLGGRPVNAVAQQTAEGIAIRVFGKGALENGNLPDPILLRTAPGGRLFHASIFAGDVPGARVLGTMHTNPGSGQAGEEITLSFRPITGPGPVFGPETTLRAPVSAMDLRTPLSQGQPGQAPAYAAINASQKTIFSATFVNDGTPLRNADEAAILSHPFPADTGAGKGSNLEKRGVIHFDASGDGRRDIVATAPSSAKLAIHRALPDGGYAPPVEFSTLPGIGALAALPGHPGTLLALNANDGVIATISFKNGAPRFPLPLPLPVEFKPLHLASDDAGRLTAILAKTAGGDLTLYRLGTASAVARDAPTIPLGNLWIATPPKTPPPIAHDETTITTGNWTLKPILTLRENPRDIVAMQVHDIDGDGRPDVMLFNERGAPFFVRQNSDGTFGRIADDSPVARTLLDRLSPAEAGWAVMDGKPALLAVSQGFLRAFRLTSQGALEVIAQANARNPDDALRAPLALDSSTIVVWNTSTSALEWFERAADSAGAAPWKIRASTRLPAFNPLSASLQPVPGEATPRLLYATDSAMVQVPTARRGIRLELKRIYESTLPDFTPRDILAGVIQPKPANGAGDIASRQQPSIALFDDNSHVLQIIHPSGPDGRFEDALHFTLFDTNPHYRGRRDSGRQPRAALIDSLTEGSAGDLLLLMHDRLLIYPAIHRETPPKTAPEKAEK
ncbi:MAG: VCBS repeat-containing protein [Puniceicoccales bacterium]|jgi:hypothetical protein|nr:VCBS repeat-containing protein [Puniceicoccales bacterium]